MSFEEVKTRALSLHLKERAALTQALLETLEAPSKEEIAVLWVKEAEQRLEQTEQGEMRVVSGEAARKRGPTLP